MEEVFLRTALGFGAFGRPPFGGPPAMQVLSKGPAFRFAGVNTPAPWFVADLKRVRVFEKEELL
jgi:hypothetical protein